MPSSIGIKRHHVLDKGLSQAIDEFFCAEDWQGLYLSGGTCIAEFYFGHRSSVDMDLFTQDEKIFQEARRFLEKKDSFSVGKIKTVRTLPHFCQFLIDRPKCFPIKVDLILDIPVCLGKKLCFEKIWIDSLPDLTANKLGRLIQRQEVKDYLDLFYLLPTINLSTPELIALGQKKDAGLDPLILAHQIEYVQTITKKPDVFLANIPWKHVQGFFKTWHDEILDFLKSFS